MSNVRGLIVQGDDEDNKLITKSVMHKDQNGDYSFDYYNVVHGAGGNDKIRADVLMAWSIGSELYGEAGDDIIHDGSSKDTLSGGEGNDTIYSTGGNDIIDGGEGNDTLFAPSIDLDDVKVTGIETLTSAILKVGDADLTSFDTLVAYKKSMHLYFSEQADLAGVNFSKGKYAINGSVFDDVFDISGASGSFSILGGGGDDIIIAGRARGQFYGGAGDDTITGSVLGDIIDGGNDNDTIHASKGNDTITGGKGDDFIDGGDGKDIINAGSGNDTVHAGDGDDVITGGVPAASETKLFDGGAGNDWFRGFSRNGNAHVTIEGGKGNDSLEFNGVVGNLKVRGVETLELTPVTQHDLEVTAPITASVEFLNSFKHIITANYTAADIGLTTAGTFHWRDATSNLSGSISCDAAGNTVDMTRSEHVWTVFGSNHDDVITLGFSGEAIGGGGNDHIIGGSAYDFIRGGDGNDTIDSRGGDDDIMGDGGADTFVFEAGCGHDTIVDFQGTGKSHDVIDLSAVKTIASYDDLIKHHVSDNGDSVTIDLGDGDEVYLHGMTKGHLTSSMFVF